MSESAQLTALYLDAEHGDGYYRDKSMFDEGINIEDVMGVMVRYKNKAIMTYSLNAYLPWEALNAVFNGSKGRLEIKLVEKSYVNGGGQKEDEGALDQCEITIYPMFDAPYKVPVVYLAGGHGGGDLVMLNDLFGTPDPDPLQIAANRSLRLEQPVKIADLAVKLPD